MNFSDSEVVASILKNKGYELTDNSKDASLILLNTCSIRDKAEQTVRNKLKNFNSLKNSKLGSKLFLSVKSLDFSKIEFPPVRNQGF